MSAHIRPVALNVNDAANALGVSARTVWNLIRNGTLPSLHIGTRVLVPYQAIEDFVMNHADTSGTHTRPDAAIRIAQGNRARKVEVS